MCVREGLAVNVNRRDPWQPSVLRPLVIRVEESENVLRILVLLALAIAVPLHDEFHPSDESSPASQKKV